MEEDTVKRKIKQIQISYSNKRELKELSNKEEFRNVIMKNSFESIKEAIKNKWTTVELFDIVNLSIIIKLSSLYFPSALKKISKHFEENEEYKKCAEITNILKNLEK